MTREEKIRAAKAEWARKYRREHPERIREAQERYWLKRLEAEKGGVNHAEKNTEQR